MKCLLCFTFVFPDFILIRKWSLLFSIIFLCLVKLSCYFVLMWHPLHYGKLHARNIKWFAFLMYVEFIEYLGYVFNCWIYPGSHFYLIFHSFSTGCMKIYLTYLYRVFKFFFSFCTGCLYLFMTCYTGCSNTFITRTGCSNIFVTSYQSVIFFEFQIAYYFVMYRYSVHGRSVRYFVQNIDYSLILLYCYFRLWLLTLGAP